PGPQLDDIQQRVDRVRQAGRGRLSLLFLPLVPRRLVRHARWLPFFRQMHHLNEALFALFEERRRLPPQQRGDNVLADLLAASDAIGPPLSNRNIRDAVVTLLVAGHDTTALALAWALEQIVPRADVVDRLSEELRQVTGGGLPRAEHLDRLQY